MNQWQKPILKKCQLEARGRTERELALMAELEPLLKRRAGDREISGLRVYETRGEYNANGE